MAENARIEDLRRRVQKDPASIAFAQLAEEHRRAGQFVESVEVCRAGLAIHPTYLSARVTLGRALIELGRLEEARTELETVLKSAPENLAAIRGVAEISQKQGLLAEALTHFKLALSIARNDPELQQTVSDLSRQIAPQPRAVADNSLTLEDMQHELKALVAEPPAPAATAAPVVAPVSFDPLAAIVSPATFDAPAPVIALETFDPPTPIVSLALSDRPTPVASPALFDPPASAVAVGVPESDLTSPIDEPTTFALPAVFDLPTSFDSLEAHAAMKLRPEAPAPAVSTLASTVPPVTPWAGPSPMVPSEAPVDPAVARAHETIAVLEQWLDAIHGSRAH